MIDAWNGYHSIPLKEEDRRLTTFITPFGRWRYTRAPQGFLSSGDGYNRRFDAILSDFERKERCVDDVLCHDDHEKLEAHWWRVIDLLITCGKSGIVLNSKPGKFQFWRLGHRQSYSGPRCLMISTAREQNALNAILMHPLKHHSHRSRQIPHRPHLRKYS